MNDLQGKVQALTALSENFNKPFSEPLLNMWLDLLEKYTSVQVSKACMEVIKNYEYKTLPAFAVLQQELDKLTKPDANLIADMALAEWELVLVWVCPRVGQQRPELHEASKAVVRMMGGFESLKQEEEKNFPFRKKDFIEHFQQVYGKEYMLSSKGAKAIEAANSHHVGDSQIGGANSARQISSGTCYVAEDR